MKDQNWKFDEIEEDKQKLGHTMSLTKNQF